MRITICISIMAACLVTVGCETAPLEPGNIGPIPVIRGAYVGDTPDNEMSALVMIMTEARQAAYVEIAGGPVFQRVTPEVLTDRGATTIPVLGLRAGTAYQLRAVIASASHRPEKSPTMNYQTKPLPADMPKFSVLSSQSPTVRYVMIGIAPGVGNRSYAMIVDTGGVPVWCREFGDAVVDFQKQPNGRYTAWSSIAGTSSHFYECDNCGRIVNEYRAANNLETDPHEFIMKGGGYALLGVQYRTMNLTAFGGLANAVVRGIVVEYHRPDGSVLFWNTFDHFAVNDAAPDLPLNTPNVNPWHGNAIDIDADGNLLVSFRNMDEVTKINSQTGEIIWRLGGKRSQFAFRNDDLNGFSHQHGIRRLANGNILLFDDGNLHAPPQSRAVEYRLDERAKTAELVWEYRPNPPIFGFALGFAQRLSNGNTLVCFGTARRIIEVDPAGTVRWDVILADSLRFPYRAISTESLY